MNLTEQQIKELKNILEFYMDYQNELYECPSEPATLFTKTQRELFNLFDLEV